MKKQVDICFKVTTFEFGTVWIDVDKIDSLKEDLRDDDYAQELYDSSNLNEMRTEQDLVVDYIHSQSGIVQELYAR